MLVSDHAISQYLARVSKPTRVKPDTRDKIRTYIEKAVGTGEEVKLSPKEELIRLLNNRCEPATYIYNNGVVYVIVDRTVTTCYPKRKKELYPLK